MSDSGERVRPHDANHVISTAAGGVERRKCPRRSPALSIIPPDWKPKPGVPPKRSACRGKEKACPYIRCRYHLWLKLSEDRDGNPKRGARPPSILWPMSRAACALAVAEQLYERGEELTNVEVGEMLGVSDEMIRHIIIRAQIKLREQEYTLRELLEDMTERRGFAEGCRRVTTGAPAL